MSLPRASAAGRAFAVIGGLLFASSLAYFLVRYRAFGQPSGPWTSGRWTTVAIDAGLFTVFALHHSVFARTGIKALISARVSDPLERTTYVWLASLLFVFTLRAWEPVPGMLWHVSGPGAWVLHAGFAAGLLLTAVAASALDPLELSGVRQAFGWALRQDRALSTTGAYGLVRHPIYLGWVLIVWSVPAMTGTRLVFAAISTFYLVVAVPLEERQMRRTIGRPYEEYARTVRWRMLPGLY
ncbi:MAG TPA: methyltransferase [Vicinamibacterales bacterium]|nr:methyltransferase [Vicinamibacterales bacterium]